MILDLLNSLQMRQTKFNSLSIFSKRLLIISAIINILIVVFSIIVLSIMKRTYQEILILSSATVLEMFICACYIYVNELFTKIIVSSKNKSFSVILLFCFMGFIKSFIILIPTITICVLYGLKIIYIEKYMIIICICQAIAFCLTITLVTLIKKK
jgi:hypothetical protein